VLPLFVVAACAKPTTPPQPVAARDASTTLDAAVPTVATYSDAAREPLAPVVCSSPKSIRRVATVQSGPAVQWVGETVVDGHTLTTEWEGGKPPDTVATAAPTAKWTVVSRPPDYFYVDVRDRSGGLVATPTPLHEAESFSDLAIDEAGRVFNLATGKFASPEPFACPPPKGSAGAPADAGPNDWWWTRPSYYLSPTEALEECNLNHRSVTLRHLATGVVTVLGSVHLVFAPNDAYVLVEPSEDKTHTTTDKLTFDAAGVAHMRTLADRALACAAGPTAYAVATRTEVIVMRVCDDAVIGRMPLEGTWYLEFSPSGALLLQKGDALASVFQLQ
jgi:hypothetical protein